MNILAIDSSSKAASCAYMENGTVIGEYYTNAGLTHSQTILPMIENMLSQINRTIDNVDTMAITIGPGSFTGLRIGLATVKGLCFGRSIKAAPVSTIETLAYNLLHFTGMIIPVMDARRSQVYTGVYISNGKSLTNKLPDTTLKISELGEYIKSNCGNLMPVLVGDGAELCYNSLKESIPNLGIAPPQLLHQRASSLCTAVLTGEHSLVDPEKLEPEYLRMSQAERELKSKQN